MAPPRNTPLPKASQRAARRWGLEPPTERERLLARLKEAERADLAESKRWDGELKGGWFSRKLRSWTRRFDQLGKWAKAVATFGTALVALAGVSAKVWRYIADRRIPPAELPAGNDMPTTALDRVPEPTPIVNKPKPPGG